MLGQQVPWPAHLSFAMGPCVNGIAVDARDEDQDKRGCQLGSSAAAKG